MQSNNIGQSSGEETSELCRLLIGLTPEELLELKKTLEHSPTLTAKVSKILPEALEHSIANDNRIVRSLSPIVEGGVSSAISKNPTRFSDLLAPIMGPAIRTSILNSIREYVHSVDRVLQHSFSLRSLKWRLEALKSGKSFAEIVLYNTVKYRVEHIFLISKEDGLLLQHVSIPEVPVQHADVISAMLNAIQSFVRDSFSNSKNSELAKLEFSDLEIRIADGKKAVIAAVIRGSAPSELLNELKKTNELLHIQYNDHLSNFTGDTSKFDSFKPALEQCLRSKTIDLGSKKKWPSTQLLVTGALLLFAFIILIANYVLEKNKWENFVQELKNTPGIVVTDYQRTNSNTYEISGLLDPLSNKPDKLFQNSALGGNNSLVTKLSPYLSLEPEMVLRRLKQKIKLPESVLIELSPDSILKVRGEASKDWVKELKKATLTTAGIAKIDTTNLQDSLFEEFKFNLSKLEGIQIHFETNTATLSTYIPISEAQKLEEVIDLINKLDSLARHINKRFVVEIWAHSGNLESLKADSSLGNSRIQRIIDELVDSNLESRLLKMSKWNPDTDLCKISPADCVSDQPAVYFRVKHD